MRIGSIGKCQFNYSDVTFSNIRVVDINILVVIYFIVLLKELWAYTMYIRTCHTYSSLNTDTVSG